MVLARKDRDTLIEQSTTLVKQSTLFLERLLVATSVTYIAKVSKNTLSELLTCENFPGGKPPDPHKHHSHLLWLKFPILTFHSQCWPPHSLACSTAPDDITIVYMCET